MRALPNNRFTLGAENLGIEAGVFRVQLFRYQDLAGRDASSTARMCCLLLVQTWDPIDSWGDIMAEEWDVNSAIHEQVFTRRFITFRKFWSSNLPTDLCTIGFLA
uniref:Uncharacterized protein n=1 Tax=Bionectria ochroleuca TaxID=29856 RepID=A0A8H7K3W0_BIOOC